MLFKTHYRMIVQSLMIIFPDLKHFYFIKSFKLCLLLILFLCQLNFLSDGKCNISLTIKYLINYKLKRKQIKRFK